MDSKWRSATSHHRTIRTSTGVAPSHSFTRSLTHGEPHPFSAKSGNDWTENDLEAYNIQLQFEDAAAFFGDSILPLPEIDEGILTTLEADDMLYDNNAELIYLLDLAMGFSEEPAVDDFAVEL